MNRVELLAQMDEELRMGRGLDGALNKAVEELLQDPSYAERDEHKIKAKDARLPNCALWDFVGDRRSRYLKPKRVEERVTIQECDGTWHVILDGNHQDEWFTKRRNAETYRLGLIQQLKEQPK